MASMSFGSGERDTSIRVLESSYKMLKQVSLKKNVPLKYMFDDIILGYYKKKLKIMIDRQEKEKRRKKKKIKLV